jgi:hypothetical protein
MLNPTSYEAHAYALGFDHAAQGVPAPFKGQCCRFYWLGYQVVKEAK